MHFSLGKLLVTNGWSENRVGWKLALCAIACSFACGRHDDSICSCMIEGPRRLQEMTPRMHMLTHSIRSPEAFHCMTLRSTACAASCVAPRDLLRTLTESQHRPPCRWPHPFRHPPGRRRRRSRGGQSERGGVMFSGPAAAPVLSPPIFFSPLSPFRLRGIVREREGRHRVATGHREKRAERAEDAGQPVALSPGSVHLTTTHQAQGKGKSQKVKEKEKTTSERALGERCGREERTTTQPPLYSFLCSRSLASHSSTLLVPSRRLPWPNKARERERERGHLRTPARSSRAAHVERLNNQRKCSLCHYCTVYDDRRRLSSPRQVSCILSATTTSTTTSLPSFPTDPPPVGSVRVIRLSKQQAHRPPSRGKPSDTASVDRSQQPTIVLGETSVSCSTPLLWCIYADRVCVCVPYALGALPSSSSSSISSVPSFKTAGRLPAAPAPELHAPVRPSPSSSDVDSSIQP